MPATAWRNGCTARTQHQLAAAQDSSAETPLDSSWLPSCEIPQHLAWVSRRPGSTNTIIVAV
jgi:hypothetical protein